MSRRLQFLILSFFIQGANASSLSEPDTTVFQMFWQPQFHGERLNYCNEDKSCCGRPIALAYCRNLGFENVKRFERAPNLGFTNFISGKNQCQGWKCSGFEWIECKGNRTYAARPVSDFRQELFVRPRWRKFPLSWCNDGKNRACGKKTAYAFCRWQGYGKVVAYSKPKVVYASKDIATNALCMDNNCLGFEYIICKRS